MDLLEVPAIFSGVRIDGDDRDAEQVVAGPNAAVQIGTGITRREIDEVERWIDGWSLPHGRALRAPLAASDSDSEHREPREHGADDGPDDRNRRVIPA